jgi:hypothetical protein
VSGAMWQCGNVASMSKNKCRQESFRILHVAVACRQVRAPGPAAGIQPSHTSALPDLRDFKRCLCLK